MTRDEILKAAQVCVSGDREQDYGSPENNFNTIARMWAAYLSALPRDEDGGFDLYAKDAAAMLGLLKIARIASGHAKDDNWIDLAGYAACGGEIESTPRKITYWDRLQELLPDADVGALVAQECPHTFFGGDAPTAETCDSQIHCERCWCKECEVPV